MTLTLDDLITSPVLQVQAGMDLLDRSGNFLEDISADLVDGSLEYQRDNDVHWTMRCTIRRELDWANVLLRPWQILTAYGVSTTYYLGVYVPVRPVTQLGEEPVAYDVTAKDQLSLLLDPIGDTYEIATGTGHLAALRTILAARIPASKESFDTASEAMVAAEPLVWVLDLSQPYTWIGGPMATLTDALAYNRLWCDHGGCFRSEPTTDPATRTPRRTLNVAPGGNACIVHPERTLSAEFGTDWGTNFWRAARDGMTTLPTEGAGQYTVDRSRGSLQRRKLWKSQAADQVALQAEVDKVVLEDTQAAYTVELTTRPQPDIEHMDVFRYTGDPRVGTVSAEVRSCTIPLRPASSSQATQITLELLPGYTPGGSEWSRDGWGGFGWGE